MSSALMCDANSFIPIDFVFQGRTFWLINLSVSDAASGAGEAPEVHRSFLKYACSPG